MTEDNLKDEWERSYSNADNFVFYPHEEIIRFVSKYIRKRVGLEQFKDAAADAKSARVLDLGCGIGRHVMYCHDMGLDAYGVDLSETAIATFKEWAVMRGIEGIESHVVAGDARDLPWADDYFQFAVSHGVLDSMKFEIARSTTVELARVMAPRGLLYCDLISGDDSQHAREFSGEEIVEGPHETDTVQLYFNWASIRSLFQDLFEIVECNLIRREDVIKSGYISRYHLVLRRV
ncbi:class I SAM-dependent methyltransferase [Marinospirillum perlucidum]|uniref:class I SAM-dependent methyltransferase n=1 Tax=Marinospirillum perlucidum TaxID=1982602 RepID=UPI000DF24552|nr:class I SAM-dependent methyltransferase [Marinospirillum perlucidum]